MLSPLTRNKNLLKTTATAAAFLTSPMVSKTTTTISDDLLGRMTNSPTTWCWLLATGLGIWFLFVHTPPFLQQHKVSTLLAAHLVCVATVYLACMHNAIITPSVQLQQLPWSAQTAHAYTGRVGLILGAIGIFTGFYMVCTNPHVDRGFAIGISIGGAIQLWSQWGGYVALCKYRQIKLQLENHNTTVTSQTKQDLEQQRDSHLKKHIGYMLSVFVMGCGVPAAMRLLSSGGGDSVWTILAALGMLNILTILYQKSLFRNMENGDSKNGDKQPLLRKDY